MCPRGIAGLASLLISRHDLDATTEGVGEVGVVYSGVYILKTEHLRLLFFVCLVDFCFLNFVLEFCCFKSLQ